VTLPPPAASRPKPAPERRARREEAEEATVDQVWSRGAEWGVNLAVLAAAGLAVLFLFYMTSSDPGTAIMILLLGGAVMVALSYPILITLERPVRITPEQAVKDFYGALSHALPHYRRMWLLLSSAGKVSSSYSSYEGFRTYWKRRLAQLRADRVGGRTPLVFEIAEFKSDKSAGLKAVDARFTVQVFASGKTQSGPIDAIPVEMGLVKGPDQMWYLNRGTLPGDRI
jgi:hypothetical protein